MQRTGAALTLYTVVAPRAEVFAPFSGRASEESFLAAVREQARGALDKALASLPDGVEAADELLEGDVVDELAALDERECDLLVCGSRGYGPMRRVLLGGVSRQADPARGLPARGGAARRALSQGHADRGGGDTDDGEEDHQHRPGEPVGVAQVGGGHV